jgi:hypothetical protein
VETLFLFCRDQPLATREDLLGMFAGLPPQAEVQLDRAVWFENGKESKPPETPGNERPPPVLAGQPSTHPVLQTQWLLTSKSAPMFPYTRAVCFRFYGSE